MVAADVLAGTRASTARQYQSAWKALQRFLINRPVSYISIPVILEFLSYMFHNRRRAALTISTYAAALADPLWLGFQLDIRGRAWELMKRGFFMQRPPPRQQRIFLSLEKVLTSLEGPEFTQGPDLLHLLRKALFLVAMASGLRASQLHALIRHPAWLVFAEDGRRVSLAPSPKFLAKNEREGHVLAPIVLQAWIEGGQHHPLCPVEALRQYVAASHQRSHTRLFLSPISGKPLSRLQISKNLCATIEAADPGKAPKGKDIRAMSFTLSFLQHFSLQQSLREGQWASDTSFVHHYLDHSLQSVPCATMAGPPPTYFPVPLRAWGGTGLAREGE